MKTRSNPFTSQRNAWNPYATLRNCFTIQTYPEGEGQNERMVVLRQDVALRLHLLWLATAPSISSEPQPFGCRALETWIGDKAKMLATVDEV